MTTSQTVHDLMAQIGPVLDLAQVTEFAADDAWTLVFDDGQRVYAEFDDAGQRLVLTAEVSAVEEHTRARACEALLRWNYLWGSHGGVRAALDGAPGKVVLLLDLPLSGLELPQLCGVVRALGETADRWRDAFGSLGAGGAAVALPTMQR